MHVKHEESPEAHYNMRVQTANNFMMNSYNFERTIYIVNTIYREREREGEIL